MKLYSTLRRKISFLRSIQIRILTVSYTHLDVYKRQELFAPGGYRMRLIDNNHTDAAVADKMSDVVGEQQLR